MFWEHQSENISLGGWINDKDPIAQLQVASAQVSLHNKLKKKHESSLVLEMRSLEFGNVN